MDRYIYQSHGSYGSVVSHVVWERRQDLIFARWAPDPVISGVKTPINGLRNW